METHIDWKWSRKKISNIKMQMETKRNSNSYNYADKIGFM
jgi:hypothetical protein